MEAFKDKNMEEIEDILIEIEEKFQAEKIPNDEREVIQKARELIGKFKAKKRKKIILLWFHYKNLYF